MGWITEEDIAVGIGYTPEESVKDLFDALVNNVEYTGYNNINLVKVIENKDKILRIKYEVDDVTKETDVDIQLLDSRETVFSGNERKWIVSANISCF